jgi:hypothetical protein
MKLGIVSCSKRKMRGRHTAERAYSASPLFRLALAYAKRNYDSVAILSAKYGALEPHEMIDYYDVSFSGFSKRRREEWSGRVVSTLVSRFHLMQGDSVFLHVGLDYRSHLIPRLESMGLECVVPTRGMRLGQQMNWYKRQLGDTQT